MPFFLLLLVASGQCSEKFSSKVRERGRKLAVKKSCPGECEYKMMTQTNTRGEGGRKEGRETVPQLWFV